jgi:SAM-dependent methyltransferase
VPYDGLKASFNSAATAYDAVRPSYPPGLVRRIVAKANLHPEAKILEIGAGTGKASVLFAKRGYPMLCLEPGIQMGDLARKNLAPYPLARVETTTFEEWPVQKNAFDLAISAQAFHWIDKEIGVPKVAHALKPGGWLAVFWNLPSDRATPVYDEIQQAYIDITPEMERRQVAQSLTQRVMELKADIGRHKESFPDQSFYRVSWTRQYSGSDYVSLLGTYSDHITLPQVQREKLFEAIQSIIQTYGGFLEKRYTCVLAMGQKRA